MTGEMPNLALFEVHFEKINRELNKVFDSRVPLAKEIGKYALLGQGKRLRPLIFVLSCELCGYRGVDLYSLSTVFEYIHTSSLLHDDVLDNAEIRRRKPSSNQIWGNQAAVLEGDFLFSKALSIAVSAGSIPFISRLTEATMRATQERIEQTLRLDYDTFINAAFFLQGKADQFTQQNAGQRKETLGSILGLEIWDEYKNRAAIQRREIEQEMDLVDGRVAEIDAELDEEDTRKARLSELENELGRLSATRKAQESVLENIRRLTASLEEQRKLVNTLADALSRSQRSHRFLAYGDAMFIH